jgi:hypothetical protein
VTLFTSPIQATEKLVTISIKKKAENQNQHKYMRISLFFIFTSSDWRCCCGGGAIIFSRSGTGNGYGVHSEELPVV